MTPEIQLLVMIAGGIAFVAALGFGIVRTLRMEDDEHPQDREKAIEEYALANGFKWKAELNMLAQSRLPALRVFTSGSFAIHFLEREDGRFETIVFDLGRLQQSDDGSNATDEFGNRSVYSQREYSGADLANGRAVLNRTVFAFRLPRAQLPELSINRSHRAALEKIPPTLQPAFADVWAMETSEDWIVFHRTLVRAHSTQDQSFAEAFAAAEDLRDAILAHWGLI